MNKLVLGLKASDGQMKPGSFPSIRLKKGFFLKASCACKPPAGLKVEQVVQVSYQDASWLSWVCLGEVFRACLTGGGPGADPGHAFGWPGNT